MICRPGAYFSSPSMSFSERAVCSASSSTRPWLFFVKTRNTPCGVRSAVHDSPSAVLTMRKFVSVSVGELNALEALTSATSRGTSRTLPPAGRPGIGSYVVFFTIARCTSGPLSDAPKMNTRNAAIGKPISQGGGRTPVRRSSSVAQLRCERRSRIAPTASSASGASQTNGAVQKNSAKPWNIGRVSHSTTSTITAIGDDGRVDPPQASHRSVTLRRRGARAAQHCGKASGETNDSLPSSETRIRTGFGSTLFVTKRVPENDTVPT